MGEEIKILALNNISQAGLGLFPKTNYNIGDSIQDPDGILVRSFDLHGFTFGEKLKAIGRAGAGTNNIPVEIMSSKGVPVFNTPGANANAVKELVIAGILMAARNLMDAANYAGKLEEKGDELKKNVENGKKRFAGIELPGRTLGVVGLGKIGSLVADAAIKLGMNVIGYDPGITVEAAWGLPTQVQKSVSLLELARNCDFLTVHVPLNDSTKNIIDESILSALRQGSSLLNFSRGGVVSNGAVLNALRERSLAYYICDFPSSELQGDKGVITLPHLGASTKEAEENCAIMIVNQIRDYLEHGNILNSVNFPNVSMTRESPFRVSIANANVPNMVGQISTELAKNSINIHNMINKSRGDMAYTLLDVDSSVSNEILEVIGSIKGVLAIRYLPT